MTNHDARITREQVVAAAHGQWGGIFRSLAPALTEAYEAGPGKRVHCPLHDPRQPHRNGDARPSFGIDRPDEGRAICTCGSYSPFDLIMDQTGWSFPQTLRRVAEHLGLAEGNGRAAPVDIIAAVAAAKRMPLGAFRRFGVRAATHQPGGYPAARVDVYNERGEVHSHFDLGLATEKLRKGKFRAGKGSAGLFFAGRKPEAGETWILCEGVKDAAAYVGLGFLACGVNTDEMHAKYARLFAGVHAIVMPDRTSAAESKAQKTAARLHGKAASVRIGTLPLAIDGPDGDDARDVLKKEGGETLLRQAVADAAVWEPTVSETKANPGAITNARFDAYKDGNGEIKQRLVPLTMSEVLDAIDTATDGWPRRVSKVLFAPLAEGQVSWLQTQNDTFGWLAAVTGTVRWHTGVGCVPKGEVDSELRRTRQSYRGVEIYPHVPPMAEFYYACERPGPGDGKTLADLLNKFTPATEVDRDLLQAVLMTLFWGGLPGARPCFVIDSDEGRGVGKSEAAQVLCEVVGGCSHFNQNTEFDKIKTRLLSPDALTKRAALLDNVKSLKFSWGELEGLITANEISGHRMYCGDASRPNTLTWFVTLNGASLSKDMAQRAVIIKLRKPHRTGTWKAETTDFVRRNRNALAADVVGALQSTPHPLAEFSRWATWENDILQRLPEPAETQKVVLERQHGADAETDECQILQDYFADRLVELNYDINVDRIHIPNQVFVVWFNTALHVKESTAKATRMMDVLSRDPSSGLDQIRRNPCRTGGRGFLWCGKNAPQNSQVKYDLTERLRRREERF